MNRIGNVQRTLQTGGKLLITRWLVVGAIGLGLTVAAPARATSILKTWEPNAADGTHPQYELVTDGTFLYGTTTAGGEMNLGTVFKVKPDGTGFTLLHAFVGGASDGATPMGGLVIAGANLYGTTYAGGGTGAGTVYTITTSGTGFGVLHAFTGVAGPPPDGANPVGTLIHGGDGYLYGTSEGGGAYGGGTAFKIRMSDSVFTVLHSFADPAFADGYIPEAGLVLDGAGNLYGTTYQGGTSDYGTVFTLTTAGTGYKVLHEFAADGSDGTYPAASLVVVGASLYGTAYLGGGFAGGTLFTLTTAGSDFTVLHSFGSDVADGVWPNSALVFDGVETLYGTTVAGGTSSPHGTVFKIKVAGDGYGVVHNLLGNPSDGRNPYAALLLIGTTLYGTSGRGGASESGAVFKVDTDGSKRGLVHSFVGAPQEGADPHAPLLLDPGTGWLFGTTYSGGLHDFGVLFKVKTDGSDYQPVHHFLGGASDGSFPTGALISDGAGNLYGVTRTGGQFNRGTVFTVKDDGTAFTVIHSFAGAPTDGGYTYASLVLSGGILFGTTFQGGAYDWGTVFKLKTDGGGFKVLHSFGATVDDGNGPRAGLVFDAGGYLYGTTYFGGTANRGTVFRIDTSGSDYTVLHTFSGAPSEGSSPWAPLVVDGSGNLYGTTWRGGAFGRGTVFTLTTAGGGFTLLHSFSADLTNGSNPYAPLLLDSGGNLWGTTSVGGASNLGTVFTLKTDGTGFTLLHSFAGGASDGARPFAGVTRDAAGNFYGTTEAGGKWNQGTVYSTSHLLAILKTGAGQGTVTSSPPGIDYGLISKARFQPDTPVTLTAAAEYGYTFDGWSGEGCTGTGTCDVIMDRDRTVTATFGVNVYALTVTKTGMGSGTVTSEPPGISCGTTCAHEFPYLSTVTLTAVADTGSSFEGWSGEGCSGLDTCTVLIDAARSVAAAFKPGIPSSERSALIGFYTSTNGDGWSRKNGWKSPPLEADGFAAAGTECSWEGVTCDASTRVTSLVLGGNHLTGVWSDLRALTALQTLNLRNNLGLTAAPVPSWIADMTSLLVLNIYRTNRTGTFPDLSGLPGLQVLDVTTNPFDAGPIPAWLTAKTSLQQLLIGGTNRTGTIPDFSGLSGLATLMLGPAPELDSAPIPAWVSGMTQLQALNLSNTNRTGDIPDLSALTSLTTLNLNTNLRMRGPIPSWLAGLTNLTALQLSNTRRTGTMPNLSTLANLVTLDLSNNWTLDPAPLPSWIGGLANLQHLYMQYTNLSGSLPSLSGLVQLRVLILSNNPRLDAAPFPSWLAELSSLQQLFLTKINRTGTIPDLSGLSELFVLDLSDNPGLDPAPIPAWIASGPNLSEVYLRNTNRNGVIPDLHGSGMLYWLDFGDNPGLTAGPVPPAGAWPPNLAGLYLPNTNRTSIGTDLSPCGSLEALDLGRNPIPPGPVPGWILGDPVLAEISLSGANLTGGFPDFSALADLYYLDLSNNPGLTAGPFPSWLAGMPSLMYLHLGNTNRTGGLDSPALSGIAGLSILDLSNSPTLTAGPVPAWVAAKTSLQVLALTGTNRTGDIPDLSGLGKLQQLYLNENPGFNEGAVPSWPASMPSLVFLQLTDTNRTGTIPTWPASSNLKGLWLGHNHLTGAIPPELGDSIVRYLQLQGNALSGAVPPELANLIQLWPPIYDAECSDLRWNALHTGDAALDAFLDSRQMGGDWSSTQTVAPTGVGPGTPGSTSVPLSWTPIPYTTDTGGYRALYSKSSGGPYTTFPAMTPDKATGSLTVTGLDPGTPYYFVVEAQTDPHSDNPNTVVSAHSLEVTATTAPLMTLTVAKAGEGSGTVTSDPVGVNCGSTCSADFEFGRVVTLSASPAAGSTFTGWSGEGCSGTGTCQVTMDLARSVTATFELIQPELAVANVGPGTGTVTSEPAGISCSGTCSAKFAPGTTVTLTATPDAGFQFVSWSGACSGTGTCAVVMDESKVAVAAYKVVGDPYTIRHHFIPFGSDGRSPYLNCQPISDGTYLYGMTSGGGVFDRGVVYRMRLDGSEYTTLHEFTGLAGDGAFPKGSLTASAGMLYGATGQGGTHGGGILFRISPDGSGFTVVRSFSDSDGTGPVGSLAVDSGVLYGMTGGGGTYWRGTVYRVNADGSGFAVLHSFAGGAGDGYGPIGPLTADGGVLYGMTAQGGASDFGTVFKTNVDGSGFTVLHSFAGGTGDGKWPWSSLAADAGVLYGTTTNGGASDVGTIFRIGTDGSGFGLVHSFSESASDGASPFSALVVDGGVLYGTTMSGGAFWRGTVFKISPNGSGFALLHSFAGGAADGATPYGSLVLVGGALYGMTFNGGTNDSGTVFRIESGGTGFAVLRSFVGTAGDGANPYGSLTPGEGALFGMTSHGGAGGLGTIFRILPDGSGFAILRSFAGGITDGAYPAGSLILADGVLYGTTNGGGSNSQGVVFRVNQDGSGFTVLHSFAGGAADGGSPEGSLLLASGVLYGMTYYGGAGNLGTVFKINPDGSGFAVLHSFVGGAGDGKGPQGALLQAAGVLYGTSYGGGAADFGTVFAINPDGSGFTVLHSFAGGVGDGMSPLGSLTFDGSVLYGTTRFGGASDRGTVFKINPNGSGFGVLHSFMGGASDGNDPWSTLTFDDGVLYGTTISGGAGDRGTVFKVSPDGSGFALLHSFAGGLSDGGLPRGSVTVVGGVLYGMTPWGGLIDEGVIFSLDNSFEVSGTVTVGGGPLAGVTMTGLPGNPVTDASGHYTATVPLLWSGTVTPTLAGYAFTPASRPYTNVQTDQTGQDYAAVVVYPLTIVMIGAGSGTVTGDPVDLTCSATCRAWFPSGTSVTLLASPSAGSTFTGWSGEGCSGTGTCEVTMTQARTVAASFSTCVVTLSDQTVTTTMTVTSCDALSLGPTLEVAAPGDLTARAGTRVTLRNGFSVSSGGVFRAGIDPGLLGP